MNHLPATFLKIGGDSHTLRLYNGNCRTVAKDAVLNITNKGPFNPVENTELLIVVCLLLLTSCVFLSLKKI